MVHLAEMIAETWTRNVSPPRGLTGRPPAGQADVFLVGLSVDPHLEAAALELRRRKTSISTIHVDVDFGGGVNLSYDPARTQVVASSVLCRGVQLDRPIAHHGASGAVSVDPFEKHGPLRQFLQTEARTAFEGWLGTLIAGRWANDFDAVRRANKLRQLRCAAEQGLSTPRSLVTADLQAVKSFVRDHEHVVCKALDHSFVWHSPSNCGVLFTTLITEDVLSAPGLRLIAPGLFQERVEKAAEYRAIVVGDAVMRFRLEAYGDHGSDWRRSLPSRRLNIERCEADPSLDRALATLCQRLSLEFAAIDLIETPDGQMYFLEANADGSYLWLGDLTAVEITGLLVDLLLEAAT